ncbi:MAG: F0F1 ATP synthase subunit B [Rhodospirillales bacterium]|nr:F0F1 ATP synthase subunit B [Rhodospirillales bacterium]
MISVAHASEAAAGGHGAFYEDPQFLVLVAFIITIALIGKTVYLKVSAALDERSEGIRTDIEEATRLREEAQDLLASFERKQRDAAGEAQAISDRAKGEADYLAEKAARDLDAMIERRKRQAKDRIAQAEISARDEIRAAAIDVALEASRRILAEKVAGKKGDALIDAAIKELPTRLH